MSELEALSNTLSMVETRMMETGETVGTDGVCIGSPSSHSHSCWMRHYIVLPQDCALFG